MTAEEAVDKLFHAVFAVARDLHRHHKRLLPFGAAMFPDGDIKLATATPEDVNAPDEEYEAMVVDGLRQQACDLAAAALVADVRIDRDGFESDALRFQVEHSSGAVACLYLPYRREAGAADYGDLFRVEAAAKVFLVTKSPENRVS